MKIQLFILAFILPVFSLQLLAQNKLARDENTINGLVAYWPFDEGKGKIARNMMCPDGDVFNYSGNLYTNPENWVEGKFGTAIAGEITGIEPYQSLMLESELTVSTWIKTTCLNGRWVFIRNLGSFDFSLVDGYVEFSLNVDGSLKDNLLRNKAPLEINKWYHVTATYNGEKSRLYINGEPEAESKLEGLITSGSRNRHIPEKFSISPGRCGAIDEVKVWGRGLAQKEIKGAMLESAQQIRMELSPRHFVRFYTVRCIASKENPQALQIKAFNCSNSKSDLNLKVRIFSITGKEVFSKEYKLLFKGKSAKDIVVPFQPSKPGNYKLRVFDEGQEVFTTNVYIMAPSGRQARGQLQAQKILTMDLTEGLSDDNFLDDGTSQVVKSAIGSYREAGPQKFSRFVIKLQLNRLGLHKIRVTYPDDKTRACEITSQDIISLQPNERIDRAALINDDCHTGYVTGDYYPLSMKFQTVDIIVWAKNLEQSLVFTTWEETHPAAASKIEIFEIEGRLPSTVSEDTKNYRMIGQYWEDAQPLWRSFGGYLVTASGFHGLEAFDRFVLNLCDYMDYTGQNVLHHPVIWYQGPLYNSFVEPAIQKVGGKVLPTTAFIDILLNRFAERGFKFFPTFNVHQLPTLDQERVLDPDSIMAGKGGYNNILSDGTVRTEGYHHQPPKYNALHPAVKGKFLSMVKELVDRYGDSPAFGGVSYHLTQVSILWTSSLEGSYDDWTTAEFEKNTKVNIPVANNDKERFQKRHEWLMANAKDKWINWRCERMAEVYYEVADILKAKNEDLSLVLNLWDPMIQNSDIQQRYLKGERISDIQKEFGVDPLLMGKHPSITINQFLAYTDYRKFLATDDYLKGIGSRPSGIENKPNLSIINLWNSDTPAMKKNLTTDNYGFYFHNRYYEVALSQLPEMKNEWFKGIGWRAAAIVPGHYNFMKYYAYTMAEFNPQTLTVGGYTCGTVGHEEQFVRFAGVFRNLPTGNWERIPGIKAPVVGKALQREGKRYYYFINNSYKNQTVFIEKSLFSDAPRPIGASPDIKKDKDGNYSVGLGPYQLVAWSCTAAEN